MCVAVSRCPRNVLWINQVDGCVGCHELHQPRCRIDIQAGADDDEDVGLRRHLCGFLYLGHGFAEPDDEGAQLASVGRRVADMDFQMVGRERPYLRRVVGSEARRHFHQLAMQVDNVGRTGPLVQVVYVLGDHRHVVISLQRGHKFMPPARTDGRQLLATLVVKVNHQFGIAVVAFDGGDVLHPVLLPQPTRIAESADAALGRHPSTCQDYNLLHKSRFLMVSLGKSRQKKRK